MNDRVVDRAAAHATPAELAVRDWLLAGLSLATGPVVMAVVIAISWVVLRPSSGLGRASRRR